MLAAYPQISGMHKKCFTAALLLLYRCFTAVALLLLLREAQNCFLSII